MLRSRCIFGALVAVLTLASTAASAAPAPGSKTEASSDTQNVRYQRSTTAPKARTEALDQRVERARAKQQAESAEVEAARAGDFHRRHQQAREMALIERQQQLLIRLIKVSEEDNLEKADLLFRLADLYLEQKAYYDLQAGALYEAIHEATEVAEGD